MSVWRPIAEAPTDGTEILVQNVDGSRCLAQRVGEHWRDSWILSEINPMIWAAVPPLDIEGDDLDAFVEAVRRINPTDAAAKMYGLARKPGEMDSDLMLRIQTYLTGEALPNPVDAEAKSHGLTRNPGEWDIDLRFRIQHHIRSNRS